ncbi:ACL056Cp [Eremothecium gossypii ATCC 10895]|uniref:Meiotic nuclear division protein 1 n=1 Tax=Eremothecium gossypii (strain ATCC 10895 / CBS 109.51 / FGSC 9923 / NRRL Y-1056) TaxID=284811 RepID=Q75CH5_EREGS|nr:ACL056Cp [Eremothecium gossypii ATCC 10895]AAS51172.2 ACL056Cp [Eremothecium gossypii ATCC 10895]
MPPKRAVVTLAEKKARVLKFFQEEHSIYSIKDLEKLIPKKCAGVSSMLVKDIVQQLIDEDGLISVEKCGNVNVYWCFKNQLVGKMCTEMQAMKARSEESQVRLQELQAAINSEKKHARAAAFRSEGVSYTRAALLTEHDELGRQLAALQSAYRKLEDTKWDETKIDSYCRGVRSKLEQLDKITDNIEVIVSFLMRRHAVSRAELAAALDMPEEFEEFEDLRKSLP